VTAQLAETVVPALDVPKLDPAPDTIPDRVETGTQNHEGIVGAGAFASKCNGR
jgi:hypothetical protein